MENLTLLPKSKVKFKVILKPEAKEEGGKNVISLTRVGIIEGYQDDIQCVPWVKSGHATCYIVRFNITKHYPRVEISLEHNPRRFQRRGKITKAIAETLRSKKGDFSDKSHPVHWIGSVKKFPNGKIRIEVTGILDGGHRHLIITEEMLANLVKPQHYINAFIYMNYPIERLRSMANGLNLSSALKDQTIHNYNGAYDMFRKPVPELFKNGYDGHFKVQENQKGWKLDIDDIVMLMVTINQDPFKGLPSFAWNRGDKKGYFNEHKGMFARLFPAKTFVDMGLCIDYCQMYMAEVLEQHAPKLVRKATVKTGTLGFINRNIEIACRDKSYFYATAASLMLTQMSLVGSGSKSHFVWKSGFASNMEKSVRRSVYNKGKQMAKIIMKGNFTKESALWKEMLQLFEGGR